MSRFSGRPVVFWLIAINVAVFLIDRVLGQVMGLTIYVFLPDGGVDVHRFLPLQEANLMLRQLDASGVPSLAGSPIEMAGHFSAFLTLSELQVWRFLSFQFLHADFGHLFFNMLALFFFGPMVESYFGSRKFMAFYLLTGIAGPIAYLLFCAVGILSGFSFIPMVGASAGIFGVLIAAAVLAPDARVMLLFPPIPMKLRTLALVMVGFGLFTVFTSGRNAGGEAAHIGGAALGLLLIRNPHWLSFVGGGGNLPSGRRTRGPGFFARLKAQNDDKRRARETLDEAEVDRILAKVREHGLQSLSEKEKLALQRATDRQRHAG